MQCVCHWLPGQECVRGARGWISLVVFKLNRATQRSSNVSAASADRSEVKLSRPRKSSSSASSAQGMHTARRAVPWEPTPRTPFVRALRPPEKRTGSNRTTTTTTHSLACTRRWKMTMQEHFLRMHSVGVRLAGLLSAGLGLEPSAFTGCFSEKAHVLRLLHYSAEAREAAEQSASLVYFINTVVLVFWSMLACFYAPQS